MSSLIGMFPYDQMIVVEEQNFPSNFHNLEIRFMYPIDCLALAVICSICAHKSYAYQHEVKGAKVDLLF